MSVVLGKLSTLVFLFVCLIVVPGAALAQSAPGEPLTLPPPPGETLALPSPGGAVIAPDAADNGGDGGATDPQVLELMPIADFNLAGIVVKSDPSQSVAMLEYQGMGYIVQQGDKIGPREGVVLEITPTSVIIAEPGVGGSSLVELTLPD
ncbi:MAG: hypothetical protein LBO66_07975 [Deltaproteobacteria bacterium]|jgi:hypothetical protein|nr:hypothetical protein [Deltaproteobacteria bacterium]